MTYALQCCILCGSLEHGHTGPADRYTCRACWSLAQAELAQLEVDLAEIGVDLPPEPLYILQDRIAGWV